MDWYNIYIYIYRYIPEKTVEVITWTIVDWFPWRHMASLDHNELIFWSYLKNAACNHSNYVIATGHLNTVSWTIYNEIIYTLRPRQNDRHFADDIFERIFLNENILFFIEISIKFVPLFRIDNTPALVQIMDWHWTGDKPFSEPMMTYLADAYMRHSASMC